MARHAAEAALFGGSVASGQASSRGRSGAGEPSRGVVREGLASAGAVSAGAVGLSELVDGVAARTGAWVVIERFGLVVTHGAGRGQCLPQVAAALLSKSTLPMRAAAKWTRGGHPLSGTLGEVCLAAVDLGEGGTAWFIDGGVDDAAIPLLASGLGDDDGPVRDDLVEGLLHPRGPARSAPAPSAVLLVLTTPGSLRGLARAAVVAATAQVARVHAEDDCVVVAAADQDDARAIGELVRERCPDAVGGLAPVPADASDWVSTGRLARAAACAARRLGLGVAVATTPAVAAEIVIYNAQEATASVRRALGRTPLTTLEEYDARTGGDLVVTLRAWCAAGFDGARAAAALHVHVNTVRYRIRRASEISGLDLNNQRHVQALQLLLFAETPAT